MVVNKPYNRILSTLTVPGLGWLIYINLASGPHR
jgi:hypothetical protein